MIVMVSFFHFSFYLLANFNFSVIQNLQVGRTDPTASECIVRYILVLGNTHVYLYIVY